MDGDASKGSVSKPRTHASPPLIRLYTSSGVKPNPGRAWLGVLVRADDGAELTSLTEPIEGIHTSNEAEYRAVIRGLQVCSRYTRGTLHVLSRSELIVRQLQGRYRVKSPELRPLYAAAKASERMFSSVSYLRHSAEDSDSLGDWKADTESDVDILGGESQAFQSLLKRLDPPQVDLARRREKTGSLLGRLATFYSTRMVVRAPPVRDPEQPPREFSKSRGKKWTAGTAFSALVATMWRSTPLSWPDCGLPVSTRWSASPASRIAP